MNSEWVCADCGQEQQSDQRCGKCGSYRVVLLSVVVEEFGEDWKKAFED